jgi:hypothetical protein
MLDLCEGKSSANSELNWNPAKCGKNRAGQPRAAVPTSNHAEQPRADVPTISTLWRAALVT